MPDDEFTSVLYPLLVAESQRQARVRRVPFDQLAESIGPQTGLVACSVTRSQRWQNRRHGRHPWPRPASMERRSWSTRRTPYPSCPSNAGSRTSITSSATATSTCFALVGWLFSTSAVTDGATSYRLLSRTGAMHPRFIRLATAAPWTNWLTNASRFDLSLAWHAWAGAEPSLRLLVEWQQAGVLNEVSSDRPAPRCLPRPAGPVRVDRQRPRCRRTVRERRPLASEGIRCAATTSTTIRLSPHVYNTGERNRSNS